MNGINYSSLMGNTELFSDVTNYISGTKESKSTTTSTKTTNDSAQTNTDKDTYEHSQQTKKAGYDRPTTRYASATNTDGSTATSKYKAIDSDGIQEGVELSDAAKNLLAELREKYGDKLEISAAYWSTDEESDYYGSLTSKDYSVLINPDLLEQMASDESVREQYESILANASETGDEVKEALGDYADSIESFTITIDADGNTTYAVKLLQDMAESNKANSKTAKELQEERLAKKKEEEKAEKKKEEKEAQEEELEEKLKGDDSSTSGTEIPSDRLQASSIEELVEMIKNRKASA
jgi:hypothetical protein